MVEGDLWRYAHTDLTDFYRGRLTLRQILVRVQSLPPEANLHMAVEADAERDLESKKVRDIETVLATMGGPRA